MEPLANIDQKRELLQSLKEVDKKYKKPFDDGEIAMVNFLGGSWNDYAQVVFSMLIADTLVNIEEQLTRLADHLEDDSST